MTAELKSGCTGALALLRLQRFEKVCSQNQEFINDACVCPYLLHAENQNPSTPLWRTVWELRRGCKVEARLHFMLVLMVRVRGLGMHIISMKVLAKIEVQRYVCVFEIRTLYLNCIPSAVNLYSNGALSSIWGVEFYQQVWLFLRSAYSRPWGCFREHKSHPTSAAAALSRADIIETSFANFLSHKPNRLLFCSLLISHSQSVCLSHTQTHWLNRLVGFNQSRNKRMAASLQLTSLMDLGGGKLQWRGEASARSERLKMAFILAEMFAFWLQPLCSLFTKWL